MNKNEFWMTIKELFKEADRNELGIAFSFFGYKQNEEIIEIDYDSMGLTFETLISLLEELNKDGLVELIDTNNMGYLIYKS